MTLPMTILSDLVTITLHNKTYKINVIINTFLKFSHLFLSPAKNMQQFFDTNISTFGEQCISQHYSKIIMAFTEPDYTDSNPPCYSTLLIKKTLGP